MGDEQAQHSETEEEQHEEYSSEVAVEIKVTGRSETAKMRIVCNDGKQFENITVKRLNVSPTLQHAVDQLEQDDENQLDVPLDGYTMSQLLIWFAEHEDDPKEMPEIVFFRDEDEKQFAKCSQEQLVKLLNGAIYCDKKLLEEQLKVKLIDYVLAKVNQ